MTDFSNFCLSRLQAFPGWRGWAVYILSEPRVWVAHDIRGIAGYTVLPTNISLWTPGLSLQDLDLQVGPALWDKWLWVDWGGPRDCLGQLRPAGALWAWWQCPSTCYTTHKGRWCKWSKEIIEGHTYSIWTGINCWLMVSTLCHFSESMTWSWAPAWVGVLDQMDFRGPSNLSLSDITHQ